MKVTVLWTGEAADAQGRETTWSGIEWVEDYPDELKLHPADDEHPVVVDREHVLAYNRME
jgi:hypothetical protein